MDADLNQFQYRGGYDDVIRIRANKPYNFVNYYRGKYGEGVADKDCMFYKRPNTPQNLNYYHNIARLSRRIHSPFLLKPIVVSPTPQADFVGIGYLFTESYKVWEYRPDSPCRFDIPNRLLDSWWIRNIKRVLFLLLEMRMQGVVHGALGEAESYVIVDGDLCIVNPTQSSANVSGQDLDDFKNFLKVVTNAKAGRENSKDWTFFLSLFPPKEMTGMALERRIKQLINHPVLKEAEERLDYFQIWWDLSSPSKVVFEDALKSRTLSSERWDVRITDERLKEKYGGAFQEVYNLPLQNPSGKRKNAYDGKQMLHLARFIRNFIKHQKMKHVTSAVIEDGLREFVPGYLSFFHYVTAIAKGDEFEVTAMI